MNKVGRDGRGTEGGVNEMHRLAILEWVDRYKLDGERSHRRRRGRREFLESVMLPSLCRWASSREAVRSTEDPREATWTCGCEEEEDVQRLTRRLCEKEAIVI
jgi:hypothetical protein